MNYIITAIDTDAGKTIVTGLLARHLKKMGKSVITMKMAQTGCKDISDDIVTHRRLMEVPLTEDDKRGLTCPYIFQFPASPHLAAAMEGIEIDTSIIENAYRSISSNYSTVILEGVGGLMVPLNSSELLADFVNKLSLPVILVTSGKLGSINHTLLSFEVLKNRKMPLYGVVYNHYPVTEPEITHNSSAVIKQHLNKYFPGALWAEVPVLKENTELDFSDFIR